MTAWSLHLRFKKHLAGEKLCAATPDLDLYGPKTICPQALQRVRDTGRRRVGL